MRKLTLLPLLLVVLGFGGSARAESLAQTFPVAGPGRLVIELERGDVEVVTHQEASVHVRAAAHGLGASSVHFEVVRDGRDVVLRARSEAWLQWLSSGPRLSVHVWVPASFEVVCENEHTLVTLRDSAQISYPTRAIGNATR